MTGANVAKAEKKYEITYAEKKHHIIDGVLSVYIMENQQGNELFYILPVRMKGVIR